MPFEDDPNIEAAGWLAFVRAMLRERALSGPSRQEMLSQFMLHPTLGIGSRTGAQIGRDNVMAGQISRRFPNEPTITGGQPDPFPTPTRNFDPRVGPRYEPYANSSAGLGQRDGVRHAADPGRPYYPTPANEQTSFQGFLATPQGQAWLEQQRILNRRNALEVLPGGKVD